jgi:hypothetical protein
VRFRAGSLLRVSVMYDVLVILFSRGEKHAVFSVSLSDRLGWQPYLPLAHVALIY